MTYTTAFTVYLIIAFFKLQQLFLNNLTRFIDGLLNVFMNYHFIFTVLKAFYL